LTPNNYIIIIIRARSLCWLDACSLTRYDTYVGY